MLYCVQNSNKHFGHDILDVTDARSIVAHTKTFIQLRYVDNISIIVLCGGYRTGANGSDHIICKILSHGTA